MVKNNIVLMSGMGQRFKDKGFKTPKPLINLNGKTITENVIDNFPECDKWIFTVNREVYENEKFINFYNNFNFDKKIFLLEKVTNGQATSCLKALELLPDGEDFFIGSCDAIFQNKIILKDFSTIDGLIFTTFPEKHHIDNSTNYGWVVGKKNINDIKCKKAPASFKDSYLISGSFYFKNKSIYQKIYNEMVDKKMYINNELYIDTMFKVLFFNKRKIQNYIVPTNIIGTPEEYEKYLISND
jgi:NDP-sugar pyrophosphorylase family protein